MNPKDFLENFDPFDTDQSIISRNYNRYRFLKKKGVKINLFFDVRAEEHRVRIKNKARVLRLKGENCAICGFAHMNEFVLEPHHIKPISEGGDHNIENLVVLCPTCHKMVHCAMIHGVPVGVESMFNKAGLRKFIKLVED